MPAGKHDSKMNTSYRPETFHAAHSQVSTALTSMETARMVLDALLAAAGAGIKLPGGALDGDPFQTGAFTFSLDAFVGDPPAITPRKDAASRREGCACVVLLSTA